jgi:CBS domain containing-hemolysin-like protein
MSNLDALWIFPVMLVLLFLKGFFSGSEIALVNADKVRLGHKAKQGNRGARLVIELLRRPERLLTTTLVGTNLATVTLTTLGTLFAIHLFGPEVGDLYGFLIYTPVFLILGEIVPKSIYQQLSDTIAPIVVYPLRVFGWLLAPIVFVFSRVARFAARRVGGDATAEGLFVTRMQLRAMLEMTERSDGGVVFDRYRIERAIRFSQTTVGEAMVPIAEVVAVDANEGLPSAVALVQRFGHNEMPVFEDNVSNVVGVLRLSSWDLLAQHASDGRVRDLARPALYVSAQETIEELALALREREDRIAIVVDEYGSAVGTITMRDVVESVVGEIDLGYPFEDKVRRVSQRHEALPDGSYLMDGRFPISELYDLLGVQFSTSQYHTVGGMMLAQLRHVARPGESVVVGGYLFTVEQATERAITRVRVAPTAPGPGGRDSS